MTTRDAAECLYDKALALPYYFLEDVFMGFAAENCTVFHNHQVHLSVDTADMD